MGNDTVRLPLTRHSHGIAEFSIEGLTMDEAVRARWDGESLEMDPSLYRALCLSLKVEEIFVEISRDTPGAMEGDMPYNVAVEIIRSLDHLTRLEYQTENCNHHHVYR